MMIHKQPRARQLDRRRGAAQPRSTSRSRIDAIGLRHDPRRAHGAARVARHDRVGLREMLARALDQIAQTSPMRGFASTVAGIGRCRCPAACKASRRQIKPADRRHPHRGRAGCWSAATRVRGGGRAQCPPAHPCRTRGPKGARPRLPPGRNIDRALPQSGARMSATTSISMPSMTAWKSSRRRPKSRTGAQRGLACAGPASGIERVDVGAPAR